MYDDFSKISIYQISNNSIFDGQGTRLVLFFQGCDVNCKWCHSPHSMGNSSPLLYSKNLCIGCERCVDACANNVHRFNESNHIIERCNCTLCGNCILACPASSIYNDAGALSIPTRKSNTFELYEKIKANLKILKYSGGITLSGGEALLQTEAAIQILKFCRRDGITTAVETSGLLDEKIYTMFSSLVDTWLYGLRLTAGNSNKLNYEHIVKTLNLLQSFNSEILIRYPVIPGFTDDTKYIEVCIDILKNRNIDSIYISPFNNDTKHYYNLSGIKLRMEIPTLENQKKSYQKTRNYFETRGISCLDISSY